MPARFFQSAIRVVGESMSASPMSRRLAISNIAWAREPLEPYLDLIRGEGVHGVELAASLIWEKHRPAPPRSARLFSSIDRRSRPADHGPSFAAFLQAGAATARRGKRGDGSPRISECACRSLRRPRREVS